MLIPPCSNSSAKQTPALGSTTQRSIAELNTLSTGQLIADVSGQKLEMKHDLKKQTAVGPALVELLQNAIAHRNPSVQQGRGEKVWVPESEECL